MAKKKRRTYADIWADAINETYGLDDDDAYAMFFWGRGNPEADEDPHDAIAAVLSKAADALRGYLDTVTLTGDELDLVRHLMPAHEVHQSGSVRWVLDYYGKRSENIPR